MNEKDNAEHLKKIITKKYEKLTYELTLGKSSWKNVKDLRNQIKEVYDEAIKGGYDRPNYYLKELSGAISLEMFKKYSVDLDQVFNENAELFYRKQLDYGSKNIAKFGVVGILVRISDKLERIINLSKKSEVMNESLLDSYKDVLNYCMMGVMVLEGEWR